VFTDGKEKGAKALTSRSLAAIIDFTDPQGVGRQYNYAVFYIRGRKRTIPCSEIP
jgi:hypothetical protein